MIIMNVKNKKRVEKKNGLGFELRPEEYTIGDADQLAYVLSLFYHLC